MHLWGNTTLQWKDFGIQLLEKEYVSQLDIIEEKYPEDEKRCCTEMFRHWLKVDKKATWNMMTDALEKIEQNTLADEIKQDVLKGIVLTIYGC